MRGPPPPPPIWDGLPRADANAVSAQDELAAYDRVRAICEQLRQSEAVPTPSAVLALPYEAELYRIRKERRTFRFFESLNL